MNTPEKPPARTPPETPAAIADVPYVPPEDRWSKPKMAEFLRVLAAHQCVAAAARAVGKSRQSAYKLRNRLKGEPFDIAWEAAFQHGYDALHQAALERALHGVEEPVFHGGEQVGTRRRYDERLTVFLLARRNAQGRSDCRAMARRRSSGPTGGRRCSIWSSTGPSCGRMPTASARGPTMRSWAKSYCCATRSTRARIAGATASDRVRRKFRAKNADVSPGAALSSGKSV